MSLCVVSGKACNCQPEDGIPCDGVASLRAQLAEAMRAREGWVMVPAEPTWEMQMAASTAYREPQDGHYTARMDQAAHCWSVMIAAAPKGGA